jgi:hypothetical protein
MIVLTARAGPGLRNPRDAKIGWYAERCAAPLGVEWIQPEDVESRGGYGAQLFLLRTSSRFIVGIARHLLWRLALRIGCGA